ncbi:MAG TPA: hypothetical protein PK530_00280 [Anaerolineales bacterium]|nr:hypothetical protein [Anaerolineales bacterium]
MSNRPLTITLNITDPGADKRIPLLRVPEKENYTIERFDVVPDTTTAASTANWWKLSLENGGTAGTAQTVIGGTVGGTAGWTANTPKTGTITAGSGRLTAGQWLNANYDENGTVAPGRFTINLEIRAGIGSKANA